MRATFPIITPDMFEPVAAKLPTAAAKKLFRECMLRVGWLARDEATEHVNYFAAEMRDHERYLREEVVRACADFGVQIAEERRYLKELKRELARATSEAEKAEIALDISAVEEGVEELLPFLEEAEQALTQFREDKRQFLVDYINTQLHGSLRPNADDA